MARPNPHPPRVAIVWRGNAHDRATARAEDSRLKAIFQALEQAGIAAEPAVWREDLTAEVREQLLRMDGVLVWVDPISTSGGERRAPLDELLREVAAVGVFVSTHPDVAARMGVKAVLYWTRELCWGSDTYFYVGVRDFVDEFPKRVATGPRVLKQNRGNGGIGVWKVERDGEDAVRVREARQGGEALTMPLGAFMAEREADFAAGGGLIDQPFQPRHLEGMIRCYVSGGEVVGFGHQRVRALAEPEDGEASPRLYSGAEDARFQRLRAQMEQEWVPGLLQTLGIALDALPVIWDADFLLGPRTAAGEDSYVLCEINVNSVFPIPAEAPAVIAKTVLNRLAQPLPPPSYSPGATQ